MKIGLISVKKSILSCYFIYWGFLPVVGDILLYSFVDRDSFDIRSFDAKPELN